MPELYLPTTPYIGRQQDAATFPQYAKTSDRLLIETYRDHLTIRAQFHQETLMLLRRATGNPTLNHYHYSGNRSASHTITGVEATDIAATHQKYWVPTIEKHYTWAPKHPMGIALSNLFYRAPSFALAPSTFFRTPYLVETTLFEHEETLYFGAVEPPPTTCTYWPNLSPWEPIYAQEFLQVHHRAQKSLARIRDELTPPEHP